MQGFFRYGVLQWSLRNVLMAKPRRLFFLKIFIIGSRAVEAGYTIAGSTQINYHFATVVVEVVKQKSPYYLYAGHGGKHRLPAYFH